MVNKYKLCITSLVQKQGGSTMTRFIRKVRILFKQMEKARSKRKAIQELEKFTDRELQDLGLGRSEIYSRVHGIK